jgi:hypothetical protein
MLIKTDTKEFRNQQSFGRQRWAFKRAGTKDYGKPSICLCNESIEQNLAWR